jgi:MFS family permease
MCKNPFIRTSFFLYVNYFFYGMVNIILASHMSFLTKQLNTDEAGISFLVSAIGFGRLFTLYLSGILSDKFGRKPFVLTALILEIVFLIGIPLSPNVTVAAIFAVFAGVANACLDSGTYPALMEAFPKNPGAATVFVRGVISIGSTLLPIMIVFFMNHQIYYGLSFILIAMGFLISFLFLSKSRFPSWAVSSENKVKNVHSFIEKPKFWHEGVSIILIGFTGPALLYIIQIWLPTIGQQVIGLDEPFSLKLLSYYSIGSLVSVFALVILLPKFIKPVLVILIYPILSLLGLLSLFVFQSPVGAIISSFVIGFSISGVLQLALTVMGEFFSEKKGQITGFIYTATSIAYTTIPLITGYILKHGNALGIIWFAVAINFIGIGLAAFVNYRYQKVFVRRDDKVEKTA